MRSLLVLAFALLLVGCNRAPFMPYHSTASIPHYSTSTLTSMTFLRGDEKMMESRQYGVIAAFDEGVSPYILLAPLRPGLRGARRLDHLLVGRGAPLSPERAAAFADGLDEVLRTWDVKQERDGGVFFEFMHAPEQDIDRISENVVEWRPAIRFNYNNTENGPAAVLTIGEGQMPFVHVVEFTKRNQVEDFRELIRAGLSRLPSSAPSATSTDA